MVPSWYLIILKMHFLGHVSHIVGAVCASLVSKRLCRSFPLSVWKPRLSTSRHGGRDGCQERNSDKVIAGS